MLLSRLLTSFTPTRQIPDALRPHRQGFQLELAVLQARTDPWRVARLTAEFAERDREPLARLLKDIRNEHARALIEKASEPSWMWGVSAPLLQAELYLGVLRLPRTQTISMWRLSRFQEDQHRHDADLHRLFTAKRIVGDEFRRRFCTGAPRYCPFFTPLENSRIPDFHSPIRELLLGLVSHGLARWPDQYSARVTRLVEFD